jgi:hypothetical protein
MTPTGQRSREASDHDPRRAQDCHARTGYGNQLICQIRVLAPLTKLPGHDYIARLAASSRTITSEPRITTKENNVVSVPSA